MKYISVDDLQAYCDNQKDHSITPNEFQRMNYIEIIRCKDCAHSIEYEDTFEGEKCLRCPLWGAAGINPLGFCHNGKRIPGVSSMVE